MPDRPQSHRNHTGGRVEGHAACGGPRRDAARRIGATAERPSVQRGGNAPRDLCSKAGRVCSGPRSPRCGDGVRRGAPAVSGRRAGRNGRCGRSGTPGRLQDARFPRIGRGRRAASGWGERGAPGKPWRFDRRAELYRGDQSHGIAGAMCADSGHCAYLGRRDRIGSFGRPCVGAIQIPSSNPRGAPVGESAEPEVLRNGRLAKQASA